MDGGAVTACLGDSLFTFVKRLTTYHLTIMENENGYSNQRRNIITELALHNKLYHSRGRPIPLIYSTGRILFISKPKTTKQEYNNKAFIITSRNK